MKNYIQPGNSITIPAPAGGVVSGQPVAVGSLRGFAAATAADGVDVAIVRNGVFGVVKVAGEAWAIGDKVYYNATNGNFTKTAAGAVLFGFATAAALSAATAGEVALGDTL
ncbi:Predicted phage recombinase, RecA/RadA family [Mesorhizobium albiziae]|uniref:Predicted phage recombinase, RecA/RadA family n=1 Tax=Neomesorhizobium albiziae TaxID=335020 RepID=A0A1I3YC92_9HYPH|nr:DUF2190 family protein [Mesorhizobium albiziae]GLS29952.1 hypothetical protein GCM10007937_16600 [Mesorhizobium albiziae]SFK29488.1 Predicted phage recombinase, RecA/RadA family [Mesorhizobium albiziae]